MNWKEFWNEQASVSDPKAQVGRKVSGNLHADDLLDKIADKIALQMNLQSGDSLLDVCCGNGFLTGKLAPKCKEVFAVDFSEILITKAKEIDSKNVNWICDDASQFNLNKQFDKVLLYFSFQYFESNEMAQLVLANLVRHLKPGGILLIGDIPDADFKWRYYNTFLKRFFAIWSQVKGKNNMGRFWNKNQLANMLNQLGLEVQLVQQENWQPYSWYRFDILAYSKK
jgi:2-polyprenyl-3-methyl-5-hydroxy-6-metoxy-1,4-benzoquinol methylase